MGRPSYTPLIETTLKTFPDLKDNYKKLAKKVGCCEKTIKRYFESLDSKVPSDNTKIQAHKESSTFFNEFIDDPSELLLSVAIRELNKSNPDPRWASILINCKKEKITTTNEVIDQFKQLPTQVLVNLLSKSLQEEP